MTPVVSHYTTESVNALIGTLCLLGNIGDGYTKFLIIKYETQLLVKLNAKYFISFKRQNNEKYLPFSFNFYIKVKIRTSKTFDYLRDLLRVYISDYRRFDTYKYNIVYF